jgi:phosphatidylglycerophosphate synthase
VGADACDSEIVGGLSVRARQILSLRDAGLNVLQTADAGAVRGPAIVVPAGLVWHPAVVKRLARVAPPRDDGIVAISTTLELQRGEFVVSARTPDERRDATSRLLRSLEKPTDGLASRHLHRPISREITRLVLPYGVTPNAMTIVASLFGFAGVAIAYRGGYANLLAGASLFWIQNVLDGCDGEIARLKYLRSRIGEWLDQVLDDVLNIAFLAAVGFALARDGSRLAWWLTWIAIAAQVIHLAGLYAALLFRAGGRGSVAVLRWWVGDPDEKKTLGDLTRRDVLSFAYLVAALLDIIGVIFAFQVVLTVGAAIVTTVQWTVWGGPAVQADGAGRTGEATA